MVFSHIHHRFSSRLILLWSVISENCQLLTRNLWHGVICVFTFHQAILGVNGDFIILSDDCYVCVFYCDVIVTWWLEISSTLPGPLWIESFPKFSIFYFTVQAFSVHEQSKWDERALFTRKEPVWHSAWSPPHWTADKPVQLFAKLDTG